MTGIELLSDLRDRGIEVWLQGDAVRWRAPRGVITPDRLCRLRQRKPEIRAALAAAGGLDGASIVEVRKRWGASLLRSAVQGDFWLVLEEQSATALRAEESLRDHPRPVLRPRDLEKLRGKSPAMTKAALLAMRFLPQPSIVH